MELGNLKISVRAETNNAVASLNRLKDAINGLRNSVSQGLGLSGITSELSSFEAKTKNIDLSNIISQLKQLKEFSNTKIIVGANGEQLTELTQEMGEIKRIMGEINAKTINPNTKPAEENIERTREKYKNFAAELTSKHGGLGGAISNFMRTLGRISFYRFIRSIIKSITKAFSEGMTNLANYSEEVKGNLSKISTAGAQIKNQLGSALYQALYSVLPIILQITDALQTAIEYVTMFFAYLGGQNYYYRATKLFTEWGEDTTKAVKEVKKSILGFDEINALNGGSNSSSSKTPDYSKMFEKVGISDDMLEKLEKAKQILKTIGIILGGYIIASSVLNFVSWLTQLGSMPVFSKLGLSAITIGLEFFLTYKGWKNILSGKGTWKDWVLNGLSTLLGTTILTAMWGPTGLVIGLGVSLVSLISAKFKLEEETGYKEFLKTPQGKKLKQLNDELSKVQEINHEIKINLTTRTDGYNDILAKYKTAHDLLQNIYDLYEKDNKSTNDITLLKEYITQLNSLQIDGLNLQFNSVTGSISKTREQAQGLADDLLKLSIQSYASDNLGSALVDQKSARDNYNKSLSNYREAYTEYYDLAKKYFNAMRSSRMFPQFNKFEDFAEAFLKGDNGYLLTHTSSLDYNKETRSMIAALEKARDSVNGYDKELKTNAEILDDANTQIREFSDIALGNFSIAWDNAGNVVIQTVTDVKNASADMKTKVSTDLANIKTEASNTVTSIKNNVTNNPIYIHFKTSVDTSELTNYDNYIQARQDLMMSGKFTRQADLVLKKYYGINGYATGGIVEDDSVIAVNPTEIVGKLSNGKTAVANNEQIIEGISRGVEEANNTQNALLREQNSLLRQLLNKGGNGVSVDSLIKQINRRSARGETVFS